MDTSIDSEDHDLAPLISGSASNAGLNDSRASGLGGEGKVGSTLESGSWGGHALSSNRPVTISRTPSQPRDSGYTLAFMSHFVLTVLISFFEGGKRSAEDALLMSSYDAGSWASVLMIVCLLSCVSGLLMTIGLTDPRVREHILNPAALLANIVVQICLGNILLLLSGKYSCIGIYFLICAIVEALRYNVHSSRLAFVGNLIDIVVEVFQAYKSSLAIACVFIVLGQTLALLWWGAFFVSLISATGPLTSTGVLILMSFSWYWITQFFQGMISFLIGGCMLWYFEGNRLDRDEELNPNGNRVILYLQCAVSSSFGSICKGALWSWPSSRLLSLHARLDAAAQRHALGRGTSISGCINHLLLSVTTPFISFARGHNRSGFALGAIYGYSYTKAASEQYSRQPDCITVLMASEELQVISALSSAVAGTMSILFGLFTKNEGSSRSLFLLLCLLMAHSGISLALSAYSSAVDAFMVAFTNPELRVSNSYIPVQRWIRLLEETEAGRADKQ
jgi:hypothetical protein